MMIKAITVLVVAITLFLGSIAIPAVAGTAQAGTEVTGTLEDMTETERRYFGQYLARKAKEEAENAKKAIKKSPVVDKVLENVTPENLTKWGTAIGEGIKAVCGSLNVEVNAFIKTTVGKLTMGLIVYKVVGGKELIIGVKNTVCTVVGYLFVMAILLFSFLKLHLPRKKCEYVADAKGKMKKSKNYEWEYPGEEIFQSREAKCVSACFHVGIFILATLIAAVAI